MLELNNTYLKAGWMQHKVHYPRSTLTAIVKGTYDLRHGTRATPSEEQFEVSGDLYADDDPTGNLRYSSDVVPFKPRADALLVGHCYAPGHGPLEMLPVSFSIGNRSKSLIVLGNSYWTSDFLPTATRPEPFARLELTYANSYGGPGFDRNPSGKGFAEVELPGGGRGLPRPNIGRPGDEARSSNTPREPAGFGPIPLMWQQRRSKAGTYDKAWLRERWPWFPVDFDWSFFNAAPEDQQFESYFSGDEPMRFVNLHPDLPVYECSLPAVRARCFYGDVIGAPIRLSEVPLTLDTVWIDMDAEKVVLTWRGVTALRTDKIGGRDWLFVAVENLAEEPGSFEHYEVEARRLAEAADRAELPAAPTPVEEEVPLPAAPQGLPTDLYLEQYARVETFAGQDLTGVDFSRASLKGANFSKAILIDALFRHTQLEGANFEGAVLAGADLTEANLDAAILNRADLTGARLIRARLNSASLAGADFSRAVLSDSSLEGVHAECAVFHSADLFGAVFRKATLNQADFSEAILHEADFTEAVLIDASLEEARGYPIYAERANLTGLRTAGAILWKSNFRNAIAIGSMWQHAQLPDTVFAGANLTSAEFDGARLTNADFSRAILRFARLGGTSLRGAIFRQADLFDASVERADLTKADFGGANLYGLKSFEAVLNETIFEGANLKRTLFEVMS